MKSDYPIDKPTPKKTAAQIDAEVKAFLEAGGKVELVPSGKVTLEDDSALLRPKLRLEYVETCKGGW